MSDSTVYNLLKSSCFMPSIANSGNRSSTMYALGADGWVCGAGSDTRSWTVGPAEWYVDLPAGTYALLYEVDGKQGAPSAVRIMAKCFAPARYRLMLVEGTEPAAWAPAEGESLAGGGVLS